MTGMNIVIAGVGGQGILLAGRVIAEAALAEGFDVKQSEAHGMAQRGGSVVSHVRFGEEVFSPVIEPECCDLLIGFEPVEALRNIHFLKKDGNLVCNTRKTGSLAALAASKERPLDVEKILYSRLPDALLLDGTSLAAEAGDPRAINLVLLGAAARLLPIPCSRLEAVIKKSFSGNTLKINLKAFKMGRNFKK